MSERHPQGSKVMRQDCVRVPITDEPDELIAHVRICGGIGPVMADSTRNPSCRAENVSMSSRSLMARHAGDAEAVRQLPKRVA